jgi:hypothetical protein
MEASSAFFLSSICVLKRVIVRKRKKQKKKTGSRSMREPTWLLTLPAPVCPRPARSSKPARKESRQKRERRIRERVGTYNDPVKCSSSNTFGKCFWIQRVDPSRSGSPRAVMMTKEREGWDILSLERVSKAPSTYEEEIGYR